MEKIIYGAFKDNPLFPSLSRSWTKNNRKQLLHVRMLVQYHLSKCQYGFTEGRPISATAQVVSVMHSSVLSFKTAVAMTETVQKPGLERKRSLPCAHSFHGVLHVCVRASLALWEGG